MRIERPRTVRLQAITPQLEGERHERGLPFDNGTYIVFAHKLNGRGHPTGEMIRVASFASPELANQCRDRINAQNQAFQAQVEIDERIDDTPEEKRSLYLSRTWPGETAIQKGPFYVQASYLDAFGRYDGGGLVAFFMDRSSAEACAKALNQENPAHEASVEEYPDFEAAA